MTALLYSSEQVVFNILSRRHQGLDEDQRFDLHAFSASLDRIRPMRLFGSSCDAWQDSAFYLRSTHSATSIRVVMHSSRGGAL